MLIDVKYYDGTYGMVHSSKLGLLIQARTVCSFRRSGRWVIVGSDPVRMPHQPTTGNPYTGPEKRRLGDRFTIDDFDVLKGSYSK